MSELKYTNYFIGALVIISCTLFIWTFGYTNTINNNENIAIVTQLNI